MERLDVSPWQEPAAPRRRSRKEILARRKRRRRQRMLVVLAAAAFFLLCILAAILIGYRLLIFLKGKFHADTAAREAVISGEMEPEEFPGKPAVTEDFLTPNEFSRPGEALGTVKNIFVHYTANQGTTAAQNKSYFENLGITRETSASAHFVIGYDGEIIQCLPLDEIGYAVKTRNYDSISIECCYLSEDGKFTDATYESLLELTDWLLQLYDLKPEDVLRHYDEGGKLCPLYYVEHQDAWEDFLSDLEERAG